MFRSCFEAAIAKRVRDEVFAADFSAHDYEVAVASSTDLPIEGLGCPLRRPFGTREYRVVSIDYSRS